LPEQIEKSEHWLMGFPNAGKFTKSGWTEKVPPAGKGFKGRRNHPKKRNAKRQGVKKTGEEKSWGGRKKGGLGELCKAVQK